MSERARAYIEVVPLAPPDPDGNYFTVALGDAPDDPTARYCLTPDAVTREGVPLGDCPLGVAVTVDLDYLW